MEKRRMERMERRRGEEKRLAYVICGFGVERGGPVVLGVESSGLGLDQDGRVPAHLPRVELVGLRVPAHNTQHNDKRAR